MSISNNNQGELLGKLVFYTVGDIKINKQDLETLFIKNGLELSKFQPGDIRKSDAMRRATSLLRNKKIIINYLQLEDVVAYIDITENNTPTHVYRYIGRKVVDTANDEVNYEQIATFIYEKENDLLTFTTVDPMYEFEFPYNQLLAEIVDLYEEWTEFHTKDTIRNIVLKIINSCMPTLVKPIEGEDSIAKFIPFAYQNTMNSLRRLLLDINQYQIGEKSSGSQFIELYDSDENRKMLERNITENIKDKLEVLISDITTVLQNGEPIPLRRAITYTEKLDNLKLETKHYASLLKTSLDILTQQIETVHRRIEDNID